MTYELKWNPKRSAKFPKAFSDNYPEATFTVITPDNIEEFILQVQGESLYITNNPNV